ncbi:Glycosyltransferase involved in cell wall bisynthesis [Saccharopolyspora antimicrobica]|uniref:Glycosyltransferase involved in cell wall biosynthesis n=1 Tax=Saccharopolyspora antimicrobica TaxID=455193 RepID=A0A1I5F3F7_9PSEU|nr:glycosyltransferase family 1 protein [Saccharopolyspora antimicrobica]RKT83664.1 glycosyltransferase involved in cell wall biosynthesis [Saccharopolyspora antimicrobica]SFO18257.1 Glycosyltransferase involved in cell wall bisynthesis [Saccharopolyspora antimicrobica]
MTSVDGEHAADVAGLRAERTGTMTVVVDARWTRTDQHDGISRYGASLIEALHHLHPVTMLIHDERQLRLLPEGVPHLKVNSPFSPRELWLSRTLNRLGADVVFSPLQVIGGFRRKYRLVLTLHDLIYYRHPEPPGFLPLPVRAAWRLYHKAFWPQRVMLNRADAVVTVSETTRRLIAEHRLTRRPVTVVHNAPSPLPDDIDVRENGAQDVAPAGEAAGGPRELVYMGSFMPYKNVETLIAGMALLPGYRLHLVSRIAPQREAELRAQLPPDADVVFWRGIGESDYQRLLGRASALVTASRDEGFGLPVIEAMNAGTPVVCSDLEIFHEVTGGHAEFFDPGSSKDFAAAVRRVEDARVRADLVASARGQAAEFTWANSAERLLELMRDLVR